MTKKKEADEHRDFTATVVDRGSSLGVTIHAQVVKKLMINPYDQIDVRIMKVHPKRR